MGGLEQRQEHRQTAARILSRDDAERLVASVLATMADLEKVLAHETAHVRVGRVRDGLAEEAKKSELASAYLRGLEAVKANAVALARFAPEAIERLKTAPRRLRPHRRDEPDRPRHGAGRLREPRQERCGRNEPPVAPAGLRPGGIRRGRVRRAAAAQRAPRPVETTLTACRFRPSC